MDNLLDGPNDANGGDDEFHNAVVKWHRLCVAGLAQVSQACSVWLLLASFSVQTKMFDAENKEWEALINDNPSAAASYSERDMHERLNHRLDMDSESSEWQFLSCNSHAEVQNFGDVSGCQSFPNTSEELSSATAFRVQSSSGQRKVKRKLDHVDTSELAKALDKLLLGMEKMSTAIVASAKELSKNGDMERNVKVFEELQSLQLRKAYMIRCYIYLAENPIAANLFLSVPIEFRADMLEAQVGFDDDSS